MLKLIRTPQKYVQGKDALNEFGKYAKDYGNRFLFVSSKEDWMIAKKKSKKALKELTLSENMKYSLEFLLMEKSREWEKS